MLIYRHRPSRGAQGVITRRFSDTYINSLRTMMVLDRLGDNPCYVIPVRVVWNAERLRMIV